MAGRPEAPTAILDRLLIGSMPGMSHGIMVFWRDKDGEEIPVVGSNEEDPISAISASIPAWAEMQGIDPKEVEDGIKVKIEAYKNEKAD